MKAPITKAILVLCLQLAFAVTTYAGIESNGLKCTLDGYKCENEKGVTSYTVYSGEAKVCDISFLASPAEDTDGNFTLYSIKVNGSELPEKITFSEPGWQEAHTSGKAVTLNKGDNTVSFTSNNRSIPQVKSIEIFISKKRIAPFPYTSFAEKGSTGERSNLSNSAQARAYKPIYRPGVSINQTYSYTFSMPVYYKEGDRFTFYGPAKDDPKYGYDESTVEYNVYLFHENPELYSESQASSGKYMFWEASIPYTGLYYLLIETKYPGEWGSVSFLLDNKYWYRYSFVSNTALGVYKEAPMGYIYVSDSDSEYNIFTVNGRSGSSYNDTDPCLWLKRYNPETDKETIVAYNDNNDTPSNFDWGTNARIRMKLSDRESYNALLSSSYPSYFQSDTCDIYHSFWNTPTLYPEGYQNPFPYLKKEDAIESYINDVDFNCIAWTCGDIYTWLWPNSDDQYLKWFDKLYNNETVESAFGTYKRVEGSLKYTREDAKPENNVINLWGKRVLGDTIIAHASIKNYSDGIPHGYDWESKCGSLQRIFHPKHALGGDKYGYVIVYYRIADNQTVSNRSSLRIMSEAIADGELIIENITLTPDEEELLAEKINNIPTKKTDGFETLYGKWKTYTDEHGYESDMGKLRDCPEYTDLLSYINSTENGELLAYDKFVNGNLFAAILIRDLSIRPDSGTEPLWNSIMKAHLKDNTMRSPRSNVTLFIKAVLKKTEAAEITEGIKHSNDDDFNVTVSSPQITVDVDLQEASKYSIQVMNLQNDYTFQLSPEKTAEKGKYTHKCDVEPGLYVVTYKLNSNINSKKIIVR